MKKMAMSVGLAVLAGALLAADQSQNSSTIQIRVTEEVHVNGVLRDSRDAIFRPTPSLTNTASVRLVSTNGSAFLNFTELRITGTNIWFRKWEYGRDPLRTAANNPMYMIASGSVGFERSPGYHLVIGDKTGLREWNKHFENNDGTVGTCLVIRADND